MRRATVRLGMCRDLSEISFVVVACSNLKYFGCSGGIDCCERRFTVGRDLMLVLMFGEWASACARV